MRALLVPILGFALIAANGEAEVETIRPDPPVMADEVREKLRDIAKGNTVNGFDGRQVPLSEILRDGCRDRLDYADDDSSTARITTGPLLRRGPDTSDRQPLAIYAVDRREAGCGVMVMMVSPEDVRPLPEISADDYRVMPAEAPEPED